MKKAAAPLEIAEESKLEEKKLVLVVDDEEKIVAAVRSYLERAGYRVASAGSAREAFRRIAEEMPSLIVLDWMLPDRSGKDLCREVRRTSNVPVVMLTARSGEEDILDGFSFGADDYVVKPFSPRQLVARVGALLRRAEKPPPPEFSFFDGRLVVDLAAREVRRDGVSAGLTPNEFGIVAAMAEHPNKVFTREELLSALSGRESGGFDRVIDTHIKNIRQKLEDDPRSPRFVLTVFGVGYKFGGME